jgi:RNA polymerase sigma-70 factor (ECF subfamily)
MSVVPLSVSDEELAARAGSRGTDAAPAFEVLVQRYGVRLLGLLRTCGVADGERENVAQEVWLRAWRALPAWRPDHFRGWLFRVARTAAEDERRRATRRFAREDREGDEITQAVSPDAPPDRQAAGRDDARKLADCLGRLNGDHRAVVEGHAAGERYEELAARLGVPVGTVQSRLSRAREALRKCLGASAP